MQKIFRSKMFYISLIFSVAIIFLASVNFNRIYISESNILIITKSEKSIANSEQIVENLSNFPLTSSFYDRIEKEVDETSISDLPSYKKKAYWNSKLKVERIGKSGILKITTLDSARYNAESLNNSTVKTLINSIGSYYDIKNDIDIRILDEPTTKESTSKSNAILFLMSLFGGFILTTASFVLSFYLFEKNKHVEKIRSDIFNFRKNLPKKEKGMDDLNKIIFEEEEKKPLEFFEKDPVFQIKKAAAPANLPTAPEVVKEVTEVEVEVKEEVKEVPEIKEEKTVTPEPIIREATAEEVKERLNKLLSGVGM